ncbi:PorP/SprF family type IX secretion system membrane protein, partial [bacterium]|nr:PorP/SprF family type IX secretion system membrane protein [bacterium]
SSISLFSQDSKYFFLDWSYADSVPVVNNSSSYFLDFDQTFDDHSKHFILEVKEPLFVDCNELETNFLKNLDVTSTVKLTHNFGIERKKLRIKGSIFPFILEDATYKKMVFCELSTTFDNSTPQARSSLASAENSVLSSGNWYKISVAESGIYRLSYQNLVDLGINVAGINPADIRLYGRPGGMLPTSNSEPRIDDLEELSIQVFGQTDGSFDENDFIIFYGQSPHKWQESSGKFSRQMHLFEEETYYFLTTDFGIGKRIAPQNSESTSDVTIISFNDYKIHENDEVNFVKSGKNWYGDVFDIVNSRTFNFNFPNRIGTSNLKLVLAARAKSPYSSTFTVNSSGMNEEISSVSGVYGSYNYANTKTIEKELNPNTDNIQVQLDFSSTSSTGKGWIDYIEVNAERELKMNGNQMLFRSLSSVHPEYISQFEISNANSDLVVWDVTYPLNPKSQNRNIQGTKATFSLKTDTLKEFIAFNGGYKNVKLIGEVANQNLHALQDIDYLIVSHPIFLSEANRLANFHKSKGLAVEVVTPQQIYNEFSAGSQDVSAIRDFAKMLYNNENPLKYMLLFGDASYDQYIDKLGGGLGFAVAKDYAGAGNLNTTHISASYAYRLQVNKKLNINAGFEAAYRQLGIDWGSLTFGDMIDPVQGFIYPTNEDIVNYADNNGFTDFAAGFMGFGNANNQFDYYFGFAAHHITRPDQGFIGESRLPMKITGNIGATFPLNRFGTYRTNSGTRPKNAALLSPNILFQKQQDFMQLNYGMYVIKGPIVGGLWLRQSAENFDAFIILLGIEQSSWKFGYSYDVTISDLNNSNTQGAHEISIAYKLPCRFKGKAFETINCPNF